MKKTYHAIGLMSGSSLDGLDLAYAQITWDGRQVSDWELLQADTIPLSDQWKARLQALPLQNALIFAKTHTYFGHYMAQLVQQFITKHKIETVDFIASHGHTIFHEPDKRLTVQIGDGAAIAALTGITTITDFRTQDIALDGEGAPLAPVADYYLFEGFDFYLNIGGIANLSAAANGKYVALDTSPANQVLNALSQERGATYDSNGDWARQGKVNKDLLQQAVSFDYYQQDYPKSLGNEWIRTNVLPLYLAAECSLEDKLATACEHIAIELATSIQKIVTKEKLQQDTFSMLATGGGVFNSYLIQCIADYCNEIVPLEITIPAPSIISFKESLLMALLGVLRMEGIPNSFQSATGAKRDTVNGAIHYGIKSEGDPQ